MGHLAVWPGLYAVGVLWLLVWIMQRAGGAVLGPEMVLSALFVFLCAQGGYLLDRAKLSQHRLDPADRAALPGRFRVFATHGRAVRGFVLGELAVASVIGALISPWLSAVPLGATVGVVVYAGRPANPGMPRPKDLAFLKSVFIATAHTALAIVAAAGAFGLALRDALSVLMPLVFVWLVVFSDAVLCDLDDEPTDRSFGTRSIPVLIGARRAWGFALVSMLVAALIAWSRLGGINALSFTLPMTLSLVAASCVARRKDLIDARLLVVALVCLIASRTG